LRRILATAAVALFSATAMAGFTTPADAATPAAATAIRPAGVVWELWDYYVDMPTCHHEGAILAAGHPLWIGYECIVDPTRPATNVGLWYELATS
jgi:hypothetical protein